MYNNNLTDVELLNENDLIKEFVADTELLYGQSSMTSYLHILLHIAQGVVDWGPIHIYSGYVFEAGNGEILKHVHAAKGVINQICRNIRMNQNYNNGKSFDLQ